MGPDTLRLHLSLTPEDFQQGIDSDDDEETQDGCEDDLCQEQVMEEALENAVSYLKFFSWLQYWIEMLIVTRIKNVMYYCCPGIYIELDLTKKMWIVIFFILNVEKCIFYVVI